MRKCTAIINKKVIRSDEELRKLFYGNEHAFDRFAETNRSYHVKESVDALFHEWGKSYEEFENGASEYTVGIVEVADGTVYVVDPCNIKFINEEVQ